MRSSFIKKINEDHHFIGGPILPPKEKKEKRGKHRVKGQKIRVKKMVLGSEGVEVQKIFFGC
jgi:hypothetical protein